MKRFLRVRAPSVMAPFFVLAVLLLGGSARGGDVLGIYTAADGTGVRWLGTAEDRVNGPVTVYLIVTEVSDPAGIYGWECHVVSQGDIFFLYHPIIGDPIPITIPPEFVVGLARPLLPDQNGTIVLAPLDYFVLFNEARLYLHPVTVPSVAGQMVYASGADPTILRPFSWSTGGPDHPVFVFNGEGGLADERTSWGAVKNLYR